MSGDGTVAEPNLRGRADAQQMRIEQVENGVFLHDGVMQATFDQRVLDIQRLSIAGGDGHFDAKGRILFSDRRLEAHLDWRADHLAAVQRPDLFVALSGNGTLAYEKERVALKGQLRVDRGRTELRSGSTPSLDDDVVVVGRKVGGAKARILDAIVDLTLDLGPDFKVTGTGLDARVEGKLHLTSAADAPLSAHGEISLVHGTYEAYGRKLEIDKGTLYFTGPLDNPGLNIRAMRKKQQVEAGVEISGTARAPRVTLVSTPDVPDTEKLSWLVLGRKVDANNHNDAQALQSAAALLLADVGTSPLQKKVARGSVSMRSASPPATRALPAAPAIPAAPPASSRSASVSRSACMSCSKPGLALPPARSRSTISSRGAGRCAPRAVAPKRWICSIRSPGIEASGSGSGNMRRHRS